MSQTAHVLDEQSRNADPELELLTRVRDGDAGAFTEIVRRHQGAALAVARSVTSPDAAEDVVSDAFERLLVSLRQGKGPQYSVRPYLLQTVRNCAVDNHRRSRGLVLVPDVPETGTVEAGDDVEDALLAQQAFASLPDRWQAVLWLAYVEQVDRAELGRRLGLRAGASAQLLVRAKEGLREAYLSLYLDIAEPECEPVGDLLPAYVRGHASKRDAATVDTHLEGCGGCRKALLDLSAINSRLGAVIAAALAGGVGLELCRPASQAAAAATVGAVRPRSRGKELTAAAAAVLVAIPVGWQLTRSAATADAESVPAVVAAAPAASQVSAPASTVAPSPSATITPAASKKATASVVTRPATSAPTATSATSVASATAKATTSSPKPTPKPTPTPTRSASPSPVPHVVVQVGTPTTHARGDWWLPTHLTIPVSAPAGTALVADLSISADARYRFHSDSEYGAWQCSSTGGHSVRCTLTVSGTADIGVDLGYRGTPTVTATIGVAGDAVTDRQVSITLPSGR